MITRGVKANDAKYHDQELQECLYKRIRSEQSNISYNNQKSMEQWNWTYTSSAQIKKLGFTRKLECRDGNAAKEQLKRLNK